MSNFINHIGERFGRLVARKVASKGPTKWLCDCDCGNVHIAAQSNLANGSIQSCGCLKQEKLAARGKDSGGDVLFDTPAIITKDRGVSGEDRKNIKVDQAFDIRLIKHIMAGAKDNSVINIIYNPVSINTVMEEGNDNGEGDVKELLLHLLDGLPEPRVKNIIELVYEAVVERHNGNMTKAARYLGVHKKTLYNRSNTLGAVVNE